MNQHSRREWPTQKGEILFTMEKEEEEEEEDDDDDDDDSHMMSSRLLRFPNSNLCLGLGAKTLIFTLWPVEGGMLV